MYSATVKIADPLEKEFIVNTLIYEKFEHALSNAIQVNEKLFAGLSTTYTENLKNPQIIPNPDYKTPFVTSFDCKFPNNIIVTISKIVTEEQER